MRSWLPVRADLFHFSYLDIKSHVTYPHEAESNGFVVKIERGVTDKFFAVGKAGRFVTRGLVKFVDKGGDVVRVI